MLDPQKTPHTSPWRASCGVSFVIVCEKIDHVITAQSALYHEYWLYCSACGSMKYKDHFTPRYWISTGKIPNTYCNQIMHDKTMWSQQNVVVQTMIHKPQTDYALPPSDIMWQHRAGPTLAQVIPCYLSAPHHYLYQSWFTISMISEVNLRRSISQEIQSVINYKNLKFHLNLPGLMS